MMVATVVRAAVAVASVVVAVRQAMSACILVEAHLSFLGVGVLVGGRDHLADASRRLAVELGSELTVVKSSNEGGDNLSFRDIGNRIPHLGEASDVAAEELGWLLGDAVEIMLGARPRTCSHVVVGEDFLQLFPRSDGVQGKACEPAHGGWREHDGGIICHDIGVSSDGMDDSSVSLQPLSWIHPSFIGLDPGDFKTMGPLECLERPGESRGPSGLSVVLFAALPAAIGS